MTVKAKAEKAAPAVAPKPADQQATLSAGAIPSDGSASLNPGAGSGAALKLPAAPVVAPAPDVLLAKLPAESINSDSLEEFLALAGPSVALELPAGLPAAPADSSGQSVEGVTHEGEWAMEKDAVHGLHIRSVQESFRRCGRRFTREGMSIALDDLEDEQVDQLLREPNLVVEHRWLTEPAQG